MHISNHVNVINYLGSKFSLLPWLLPHIQHVEGVESFVDVFGGSGNVMANIKPYPIETYNDINHKLVMMFKVLREQPEELMRSLELTPHSRHEYEQAWYSKDDTELEQARKFIVRLQQSFFATGAQAQLKGWISSPREIRRGMSQETHKWLTKIGGLPQIVDRFRRVQIECRGYEWILSAYDGHKTLFYCDPPYDAELRSNRNDYEHDFTEDDHKKLHDMGLEIKGKIAVSGYDSEFMKELYKDYHFYPGPRRKNSYSKKEVRECIWTNYEVNKRNLNRLF